MNKINITKAVLKQLTTIGTGAVVNSVVASHRAHSDNKVIETVYTVASIVTAYAAAGTALKPMHQYVDEQVDALVEAIDDFK